MIINGAAQIAEYSPILEYSVVSLIVCLLLYGFLFLVRYHYHKRKEYENILDLNVEEMN
jgi:hypothetical protein